MAPAPTKTPSQAASSAAAARSQRRSVRATSSRRGPLPPVGTGARIAEGAGLGPGALTLAPGHHFLVAHAPACCAGSWTACPRAAAGARHRHSRSREAPMRLEDKVAIITGAGQGIGEAYARRSAKEGARVVVADVNAEKGAAVARDIGQIFERVDVSSEDDTQRLCRAVADRFGRIDVLINNAAIFFGIDNQNTSYAYLRKIFDVNYFGAWLMCRAVSPHMPHGGGGSIINQSSGAAYMHPEYPIEGELPSFHYSVTKAAMNAMTHYMAGSVGRYNIRVNAIAPGPTMTEATRQGVPAHFLDLIINFQMAIHRALDPDDLTGTAVWLASDDAKMGTGQVVPVAGGMIMRG